VWDATDGCLIREWGALPGMGEFVTYSPDGKLLA
jgi:hypothetical protein